MCKFQLPAACLNAACLASAPGGSTRRLAVRAEGDGPMLADLRELGDGIGRRPTGSAACDRRSNGPLENSAMRARVPHLWLPVSAEAAAVAPQRLDIRIAAAPFQPLHQRNPAMSPGRGPVQRAGPLARVFTNSYRNVCPS